MALEAEVTEDTLASAFSDAAAGQPPSQPPAPPAAPAPQDEPFQSPLLDRARTAGLELGDIDSHEKLSEYLLDQYIQTRPYADLGRSTLASPIREAAGNHGQADSGTENEEAEAEFDPEAHFNTLWNAPQLDAQAKFAIERGLVQLGENGLYVPTPGPFEAQVLPIISQLNQAHIAQREQLQKFFDGNPYKAIHDGLMPAFEARFQKLLDERLGSSLETYHQEQQEQSFVDRFKTENKTWLFAADGKTLTPEGVKFSETVAELRQKGINDPQTLASYAIKLAGINTNAGAPAAGSPAAPAAPAPSTDGRPRDEHGRYLPAGTPAPAATPTKQESFLEKAKRRQAHAPSSQSADEAGADAVIAANQGDLDNMWSASYRQKAAVA